MLSLRKEGCSWLRGAIFWGLFQSLGDIGYIPVNQQAYHESTLTVIKGLKLLLDFSRDSVKDKVGAENNEHIEHKEATARASLISKVRVSDWKIMKVQGHHHSNTQIGSYGMSMGNGPGTSMKGRKRQKCNAE